MVWNILQCQLHSLPLPGSISTTSNDLPFLRWGEKQGFHRTKEN